MTEKLNIRVRHKEAMENAQQALVAKEKGHKLLASKLYLRAFEIEKEVALFLENDIENEPTRSVIFRSAASFANICGLNYDAKELINKGLSGNPPKDIEDELRALLKDISENSKKVCIDFPLNRYSKRQSVLTKRKIGRRVNSASQIKRFQSAKSIGKVELTSSIRRYSIEIIKKVLPSSIASHVRHSHVSH